MIKFTSKEGCVPTISTKNSAGADLVSNTDMVIAPGSIGTVGTGVWIYSVSEDILDNAYLAVFVRSSLAKKQNICLANGTGIIDLDYSDEIKILLHNFGDTPVSINKGERIAQMILSPHLQRFIDCNRVMSDRSGGFGSTNVDASVGGLSTADTTDDLS